MRWLPDPEAFRRGRIAALVSAELFALEQGAIIAFSGHERVELLETNQLALPRGVAFGLPLAALAAGAVVAFVARRRPALFGRVERVALLASPLLSLWALPGLLSPNAFDAKPLALMVATAVLGVVLERTLSVVAEEAPALVALAAARSRLWDFVSGIAILAYALTTTFLSIRLHDKGLTSNFDLGLFENLIFNALHGKHGYALGDPYFGVHFEPILYAVLPCYALVPRTETLLALQSFALGGAALPLYLTARRFVGPSFPAFVVVFAFLSHPSLHGPNFYDFHFLALSPFFVGWAAYFFVRRSPKLLALAVFGALLCREDVALALALVAFGLLALRVQPKTSGAVLVTALGWFLAVKFVWMRRFMVDSFSDYYEPLIRPGDEGFSGVLETVLTNPLYVASTVFTGEKLLLALQLFVPFAWLPVRQWRTLPLLLPGLAIVGLAASDSSIVMVQFHYSSHFLPYLALATIVALAVRKRAARFRAVLAMVLGATVVTCHYGAFVRSTFRPAFHEVSFDWTREDEERREALRRIASAIPADAAVAAGEHEGPHFARRARLYALKSGVKNARYVVFSRSSLRWGGTDRVERALQSKRFGIARIEGPFVLLVRGGENTGDPALEALHAKHRL
jgi:uncharacterized membrane protein